MANYLDAHPCDRRRACLCLWRLGVMDDIRHIPVEDLQRRDDARPQDEAAIASLVESIGKLGLMAPLVVRLLPDDRFEIIAGSHRFAACDQLEMREIPCRVVGLDDLHAELAMIDENLCRSELSGILRDQQTARRKALYVELHPETRHGTNQHTRSGQLGHSSSADAGSQTGDTHSIPPRRVGKTGDADRFTTETAALTGQSERTVRRSAERGEKIAPEAAQLMAGTRLDTGTYADRIKDRPAAEQVEAVRRDLATSPPSRQHPAQARPVPKPTHEPGEAFTRFLELADELEAIGVRELLEAVKVPGPARAKLGQRAGDLATMMEDIARGLD